MLSFPALCGRSASTGVSKGLMYSRVRAGSLKYGRSILLARPSAFGASSPLPGSFRSEFATSAAWSTVSERIEGAIRKGILLEDAAQKEAAHQADRCITRVRKYASERHAYLTASKGLSGPKGSATEPTLKGDTAPSPSFLQAPSVPPTPSEPRVFHPAIRGRPSALHAAIAKKPQQTSSPHPALAAASSAGAAIPNLSPTTTAQEAAASAPIDTPVAPRMPKGLYLYGSVGSGKTQIMDTFIAALNDLKDEPAAASAGEVVPTVRRLHFHSLLASIHARLHEMRQQHPVEDPSSPSDRDLIAQAAVELSSSALVVCVDDLELVDVADAFLLDHYFRTLHRSGTVLVFSSNWAPSQLYKDGLQKELFVPFRRMVEAVCRLVPLQGGRDYRQHRSAMTMASSHSTSSASDATGGSASRQDRQHVNGALSRLLSSPVGALVERDIAISHGRTVKVRVPSPRSYSGDCDDIDIDLSSLAVVEFEDLCGSEAPLGAADFTALAMPFRDLLVRGVPSPSFKRAQHNELRRLVHACDVFYDLRARLRVVAEGVGSASPVLEAPLELASLFSSFLPVEDALAGPSSRSTSEGGSSAVPDTLSTKPTVFVADDDTTAGKGRSNKKLLQDTTDAPASNILSVRVEEAAKATLHMGIRRALSRLVEMAASDSSASSSSSSPSAAAAPSAPAARAFDALNRALLVDQVPQSVKATLLK